MNALPHPLFWLMSLASFVPINESNLKKKSVLFKLTLQTEILDISPPMDVRLVKIPFRGLLFYPSDLALCSSVS